MATAESRQELHAATSLIFALSVVRWIEESETASLVFLITKYFKASPQFQL